MKIFLIRHGETTGDIEDRYGGDYDDYLTEKGQEQVKALAEKLKGKGIQFIYHSSRIRAYETARILGEALDIDLREVSDMRERNNYGVVTGMKKSEAKEKHPKEVEKLETIWMHHGVTGSEDYESFKKRVVAAFEGILDNDEHDVIAIVSHGGPISCITRDILKLGKFKSFGDCGFLELEKDSSNLKLVSLDNASLKTKILK
ncbi:MAG: histidine phosphatase family protein [archaeon]